MRRLMPYLHTLLLYPVARLIVHWKSAIRRIEVLGKMPKLHFQRPYAGQKIILLALYEKGTLRPDVLRLLKAAKSEGLYIVAVNTLTLSQLGELEQQIDCYIERPNFGRDFGSYKAGFLHVFSQGWHQACPRLLMMNDSVFFSASRLPKFLNELLSSDVEVLGATENFEIEHHLGSFCIAIANPVLKSVRFQNFWKFYMLSDIRTKVIKYGEIRLSIVLKKCVSGQGQFAALYSGARFFKEVQDNPQLVDFYLANARTSDLVGWQRMEARSIEKFLDARFTSQRHSFHEEKVPALQLDASLATLDEKFLVMSACELKTYLLRHVRNADEENSTVVDGVIQSALVNIFISGSQIHQNACPLVHMGFALIKLDGLYRGMFSVYDVSRIVRLLDEEERREFQEIILTRPYGGDCLVGWKRAAFMVGLI